MKSGPRRLRPERHAVAAATPPLTSIATVRFAPPRRPGGIRLLFAAIACWFAVGTSWAAQRSALVIGNANYTGETPLQNTLNDARDVADKLRGMGFQVTELQDAGARQMRRAVSRYLAGIRQHKGTSVIYYSGHGVQDSSRSNYLLPVDAKIEGEADITAEGIAVNNILANLARRPDGAVSLVVLDACRNNPFSTGMRGTQRGLARVEASPHGTLVLYAASPGQTADDNPSGRNGLFTHYLLAHLDRPGLDIEDAFDYVALAVERDSAGRQRPYKEGNLLGKYYLGGGIGAGSGAGLAPPAPGGGSAADYAVETRFWDSTERCGSKACYQAYLAQYPNGRFIALAKVKIASPDRPARPEPAAESCCRLTVKTTPSGSQVRIMNIGPRYRDGIALPKGRYRVRVDREGYRSFDNWIDLSAPDQVLMVDLERAPPAAAPKPTYSPPVATPSPAPQVPPSGNAIRSSTISLKAPVTASNGCVVPLTVDAGGLSAKQIAIYSGSRANLALRADLIGRSTAAFVSTRVKMPGTGPIIADVTTRDGRVLTNSTVVRMVAGCTPAGSSGRSRPDIKARAQSGVIKLLLLEQPMSANDYISSLTITNDGQARVRSTITPWTSANPYFSFKIGTGRDFSISARTNAGAMETYSGRFR